MPNFSVNGTKVVIPDYQTPKINVVLQFAARLDLDDIDQEIVDRGWEAIKSAYEVLVNSISTTTNTTAKPSDRIVVRRRR